MPSHLLGLKVLDFLKIQLNASIGVVIGQGIFHGQLQARRKFGQDIVEIVLVDIDLASFGQRALLGAVTVIAHHHEFERQLDFFLRTASVQIELDIHPRLGHFVLEAV
ncbi:hypothetical protein D9M71_729000 [compost metagenome]